MVKSACGIEAVYMCFNGTGNWGGETICRYTICSTYNISVHVRHVHNKKNGIMDISRNEAVHSQYISLRIYIALEKQY